VSSAIELTSQLRQDVAMGGVHVMRVGLAVLVGAALGCATGLDGGDEVDAGSGSGNGNGSGNGGGTGTGFADASPSQPDGGGGGFGTLEDADVLPDAQPGNQRLTITYNVDAQTIATSSPDSGEPFVGCFDPQFRHTESAYHKVFDLAGDFGITGDFVVELVRFGVLLADSGGAGGQPVRISVAHQAGASVPDLQGAVVIQSVEGNAPDINRGFLRLENINQTVPAGRALIVELLLRDGISENNQFHIGVNFAGEGAPSFLQAPACGLSAPTPFSQITDPDGNNLGTRHWIVEVTGVHQP
jgi:hypothetical protein